MKYKSLTNEEVINLINELQIDLGLLYTELYGRRGNDNNLEIDGHKLKIEKAKQDVDKISIILCGLTLEELQKDSRLKEIVLVRTCFAYMLNKDYNLTLNDVGRIFKRHHATIIHAIKKVEDNIYLFNKSGIDQSEIISTYNKIKQINTFNLNFKTINYEKQV